MPWFDAPTTQYPRGWSEYSLDYRLFFIWAIVVLVAGSLFENAPAPLFYGGIAAGALAFISLSTANRRKRNWHWPGVETADVLKAIGGVVLMVLFFYVCFRYLPRDRSSVPVLLFALSIAVVNILTSLNFVQLSEIDFERHCYDPLSGPPVASPVSSAKPVEPQWKRVVRGVYRAAFLVVCLAMLASIYLHENYVHDGARQPTATQTETINEHRAIIYVTPRQKRIDSLMQVCTFAGLAAITLGGLFVQFVLGVTLFANRPAPRGIFDPKDPIE